MPNRKVDLNEFREKLKNDLRQAGVTEGQLHVLEIGSSHGYYCRCGTCRLWWKQLGPEEDGRYGPFTKEEIDGPTMDGYTEGERLESLEKAAKEQGDVEIVFAAEDELLLDLDTENDFQACLAALANHKRTLRIKKITWWRSSSGNRHVRVKLRQNESVLWRIALQATLFSDRKKELLSLLRVASDVPHPVVLFKPRTSEEMPL